MNNASIPTKASPIEIMSLLLGLRSPKKHISVEIIMTPPVTMGYCTEASTCARAKTKRKFAILLVDPDIELTTSAPHVYGREVPFCLFFKIIHAIPESTMVVVAIHMEYEAALVFSNGAEEKILLSTPDIPLSTNTPA